MLALDKVRNLQSDMLCITTDPWFVDGSSGQESIQNQTTNGSGYDELDTMQR